MPLEKNRYYSVFRIFFGGFLHKFQNNRYCSVCALSSGTDVNYAYPAISSMYRISKRSMFLSEIGALVFLKYVVILDQFYRLFSARYN